MEAPTSRQGEPQGDMEASTSGTHQDEEDGEVQQEDPPQPPSPPPQGNDNTNNNEDEDEEEAPRPKQKLTRVRASMKKNHPIDQILDDINSGRITRSKTRLANFCEHYSFISSVEPMKVEEALEDVDWVNAMHEELHNFERTRCGHWLRSRGYSKCHWDKMGIPEQAR